jgi:hypothetical protein
VHNEAYAPLSSSLTIDLVGSRGGWGAQRFHRRAWIEQNQQAFETFSDERHPGSNVRWVGIESCCINGILKPL